MKGFLFIVILGISSTLFASSVVGSVELMSGILKIKSDSSIKKKRVLLGQELVTGDMIVSSKNSSAKLKLVDGSILVLDEKSTLHFLSEQHAKQLEGKVLYKITSRDSKNALVLQTPFAIIGIKGTTFIVNATENSSVSLQEGLIGVRAINEEFELYRKRVQKEFDDYINKQDLEFEKFKNAQNQYAKVESTKEFDLEAGNKISFEGVVVKENALSVDDSSDFEYFEKLLEDMK